MAASQTKKQRQDQDEHPIPVELFRRVNAARQPCAQFKAGVCRKYRKCPRSHDIDGCSDMNFKLPYTSRYIAEDGRDVITLRPPLTLAGQLYFSQLKRPCVLGASRQWNSKSGKRMITYVLENMVVPDYSACEAASASGFARTCEASRSSEKLRYERGAKKPEFHSHTTSLKAALSILSSGAIRKSPGIAGVGVYSFACDSDQDSTALNVAWSRGVSGGYNECALFVYKAHGIIVHAKDVWLPVPPGATACKNDQYSSHEGVVEYMSFTTTVDGLLGELSQQLDECGYTQALHEALMDVKTHMETETVSKGYDVVFLKNSFVEPKPKLVVPPSASGKGESGEKDDDPWEEWYKFYDKDFVDEKWTDQGDHWNDQRKHDKKWNDWGSASSSSWRPPAAASESWGSASSSSWRPQAQPRHACVAPAQTDAIPASSGSKSAMWDDLSPVSAVSDENLPQTAPSKIDVVCEIVDV
jgi:hypothetical protein